MKFGQWTNWSVIGRGGVFDVSIISGDILLGFGGMQVSLVRYVQYM